MSSNRRDTDLESGSAPGGSGIPALQGREDVKSSGWDEYVAGGDLGMPAGESDVDYAGFDAAAASAVSTDLVDGVVADRSAETPAGPEPAVSVDVTGPVDAATAVPEAVVESVLEAVDTAAIAQDWADWNTAAADEWASSADSYVQHAETNAAQGYTDLAADALDHAAYQAGVAGDHYGTHAAEQDLGGFDPSGDEAS
jgi:hypothetical protein